MKKNVPKLGRFLYYLISINLLLLRSHAFLGHTHIGELIANEVYPQEEIKEKDQIIELPGQLGKVNFGQYGGYVTVNKRAGRAFFYYFVEANGPNKDSAPLLLWLNGGPGCSSFGNGAMTEIGPFRVRNDGKTLYENVFAWNKVANVLFLESPAGVGFSYSNKTSDIKTNGDKRTAADGYVFLLNWLQRFPEYKNRDFYITGESYAGHYIPQLANTILQHNKLASNNIINLKGIAMGNPSLDTALDDVGKYNYLWAHAMISDNNIEKVHKTCNFSQLENVGKECELTLVGIHQKMGKFNPYNIYAPLCHSEGNAIKEKPSDDISITNFDPCTAEYVKHYFNLPEVQLSLHANVTKLHYPWRKCSDEITLHWKDSAITIVPLLQNLLTNGIQVLVFSGDYDSVLPYTGTKEVLKKLNLTEKIQWTPWNVCNEVAGYSVVYNGGLTFSTVRGAGHMVPSDQPERAFTMIKSFLKGEPLPEFV